MPSAQLYYGETRVYPSTKAPRYDESDRSKWTPEEIEELGHQVANFTPPCPLWLRMEHNKAESGKRGAIDKIWLGDDQWMWARFYHADKRLVDEIQNGKYGAVSICYEMNKRDNRLKKLHEISLTEDPDFRGARVKQTSKGETIFFNHSRTKSNKWVDLRDPRDMEVFSSDQSTSTTASETEVFEHNAQGGQGGAVADYTGEFMKLGEAERVLAFNEAAQRLVELEQKARQKEQEDKQKEQLAKEQQWINDNIHVGYALFKAQDPNNETLSEEEKRIAAEDLTRQALQDMGDKPQWLNVFTALGTTIVKQREASTELQKQQVAKIGSQPLKGQGDNLQSSATNNNNSGGIRISQGMSELLSHNAKSRGGRSSYMDNFFNRINNQVNNKTSSSSSLLSTSNTTTSSSAPAPSNKPSDDETEQFEHSNRKRNHYYGNPDFDVTPILIEEGFLKRDPATSSYKPHFDRSFLTENVLMQHSRSLSATFDPTATQKRQRLGPNAVSVQKVAHAMIELGSKKKDFIEENLVTTLPEVFFDIAGRCCGSEPPPTNAAAGFCSAKIPSEKRPGPTGKTPYSFGGRSPVVNYRREVHGETWESAYRRSLDDYARRFGYEFK
jgi:hypothetical protein